MRKQAGLDRKSKAEAAAPATEQSKTKAGGILTR